MNRVLFFVFFLSLGVGCGNHSGKGGNGNPSAQAPGVAQVDSSVFDVVADQLAHMTEQNVPEGEEQIFGLAFGEVQNLTREGAPSLYDARTTLFFYLDGENRPASSAEVPIVIFTFSNMRGREPREMVPAPMTLVEGTNGCIWKVDRFIAAQYGYTMLTTAIVSADTNLDEFDPSRDVLHWIAGQDRNSAWEVQPQVLCFWVVDEEVVTNPVNGEVVPQPSGFPQLLTEEDVRSAELDSQGNVTGEGILGFTEPVNVEGMGGFVRVKVRVKFGRFADANNQLPPHWQPRILVAYENMGTVNELALEQVEGRTHIWEKTLVIPGASRGYTFITIINTVGSDDRVYYLRDAPRDSSYRSNLAGGNAGLTFHVSDVGGRNRIVLGVPGE